MLAVSLGCLQFLLQNNFHLNISTFENTSFDAWLHHPPVAQQNPVKGGVVSVGVASKVLGDANLEVAQIGGGQGNVGSPGWEKRVKVGSMQYGQPYAIKTPPNLPIETPKNE